MDYNQYTKLKSAGAILSKVGDQVFISMKQFDPNTGIVLKDKLQQIDINTIQDQLTNKKAEVTNLQSLLADITALG